MTQSPNLGRPSFLRPGFISLRTTPCSWNNCIFCGFSQGCTSKIPTVEHLVGQLRFGLNRFPDKDSWCILNKGSFFDDRQIPNRHRLAIAECLHDYDVKRVFIESRPEFVTGASLREFREQLGSDRELTTGVGLETSDERLLDLIRKGISLKVLEKCVILLRENNVRVQTFLMAGLPGANEPETTLQSIRYAKEIGSDQIMISATVPRRGSELQKMWQRKEWRPIDITLFYQIVDSARTQFASKDVEVWPWDIHSYQSEIQIARYKQYRDGSPANQLRIEDFRARS